MEITETLYVANRREWRRWLSKHHTTKREIWLIYPRKGSGRPRIPYDDAVEEALCFGWIDGLVKRFDESSSAQRFTPRKAKSNWSELNKERARRLIESSQMTEAGLAKLGDALDVPFEIPADILRALRADKEAWRHFRRFPESYKRIRIGFIESARKRPEAFQQRLANFIKMTALNKRFGSLK